MRAIDKHKKWILITLLAILIIGGGFLFIHNRSIHQKQVAVHIPTKSSSKSDKSAKKSSSQTANSSTNQSTSTTEKSTVQATGSPLVTPSGTFVSNHRPSLSGSDLLKQEKSVCNTTPGATCYILFMKDGVAKQLDPQVVDSSGSTYWTWDVNQAGFTPGVWKITAVASLNGQTLSRDDGLAFEVQP